MVPLRLPALPLPVLVLVLVGALVVLLRALHALVPPLRLLPRLALLVPSVSTVPLPSWVRLLVVFSRSECVSMAKRNTQVVATSDSRN